MRKKIFSFLSFTIYCLLFTIHCIYGKTGSTGWIIFRKAQSPKPKPITTVCAIRGDLSGVLYNPSVLATVGRKEIFTMAEFGLTEDRVAGIIYAHPFGKQAVSIGAVNYDAGMMELYWIENGEEKSDKVSAQNDWLGIVSYAKAVSEKFHAGVTAKFATSKVVEKVSANAYALDIGVSYLITDRLVISFAGQNLGGTTKFVEKAEKLPVGVFTGAGYTTTFGKDLYFVAGGDVSYILDETRIIPTVGIEIGRAPVGFFVGYRLNVEESIFNIGLSISLKNFDISYSYTPSTWLNPTNRISLGVRF